MTRRFVYLGIVLVWLLLMCFPVLAFTLAINGQVAFGDTIRIFLVQDDDNQGIGIQWNRRAGVQENCLRSSVRYFLWEQAGQTQNVDYCRCYEQGDIEGLVTGNCEIP